MSNATNNNPLAKHFRQPSIYIKLVSNGKFWKDNTLELPVTGEIPVYPMTAKDEIVLRTPDALINGTSVVQVIQSCCPNVKDAWEMPSVDVDFTLIAIRIASYGPKMAISAKCPKCNEEHDYDIDLHNVLAGIQMPNYDKTITTPDGLIIKFKPLTYKEVSKAGGIQFEEDKLIQTLASTDISEEVRKIEFDKHMAKMIDLNNDNLTYCTYSITADGTEVVDPVFIKEFYINSGGSIQRLAKDAIKEFAEAVSVKPIPSICSSCEHEFKLNVDFDYARFFDKGF